MALRNKILSRIPFFGQFFGQATTPPVTVIIHGEPSLTINVDKTDAYIGEIITFSGVFRDDAGDPIPMENVKLIEGSTIAGITVTDGGGNWAITWTPGAVGTYTFYAEAELPTL